MQCLATQANRACGYHQVPEWLYNHWSSCPTDNQEVGSVVIQEGPSTRVLLNLTDSAFDTGTWHECMSA